jgi:ring-1,2-phenylacetyl-CoA epoxidase subunit PaaC
MQQAISSEFVSEYLTALADDELILGHRDSEWCGHAPILEEDIAFANIALDEIGHARLWYELAAQVLVKAPAAYPDQQVFFRPAADFRCLPLVELPNGDWAFSMLRQYLFDAFEARRLERLAASSYKPLAEIAGKIRNEELYHLRHTRAWVLRLGQGTEESHDRMEAALDALWPYALGLGLPLPGEAELVDAEIVPSTPDVFADWQAEVKIFLEDAALTIPQADAAPGGREAHTPHLAPLLAEMQVVARVEPQAKW